MGDFNAANGALVDSDGLIRVVGATANGKKSDAIVGILGYRGRIELIHRDDLIFHRSVNLEAGNHE